MVLKVIGSGSSGNCYVLEGKRDALVIECGMPMKDVKIALDFNVSKIEGALVSHMHNDHNKYSHEFEKAGIEIFRPFRQLKQFEEVQFGRFKVTSFPLIHDVPCYGFLIEHPEIGRMIYASDTQLIRYKFKDIDHMLIEANYSKEKLKYEPTPALVHIKTGHMEIGTACRFIKANRTDRLKTVILCHISEDNGDHNEFKKQAKKVAKCRVHTAKPKLMIVIKGDKNGN